MENPFIMKRRPLIKEAKARSLEPRGLMLLERGSVVSRDIAKTASPLTVAIVDQGKRRDVSRGCCRRRRQTVTVGKSKGKDEFIYGLIKRHDPERAVLSLRKNPHDRERVLKEPMSEPSSEHERVEMSRALRDVTN
ncbi:hypothetical protein YC2023_051209 [Brassica napus]